MRQKIEKCDGKNARLRAACKNLFAIISIQQWSKVKFYL